MKERKESTKEDQLLKGLTDEELMGAYQKGDERAFTILYERHSPKVYGFLKKKLREQEIINDVFQATFLKLHQARSHYDPSFPFAPWLFTVCRSVMVSHIRVQNRVQEDLNPVAVDSAASENSISVEGTAAQPLLADLSALPLAQRQAIEMRFGVNELSFEEIAKRLETSPVNARQLVSRGIKRLKSLITEKEKTGRNKDEN